MQFGGARRSLGGPGWSPGIARGLPGCNRAQNEGFIKFGKRCFWPPGGVWGAPPYIIVRNKIPNGARQAKNMLWDDDPAPFSSDKIFARILSAAITRTTVLPAGVRMPCVDFHLGVG